MVILIFNGKLVITIKMAILIFNEDYVVLTFLIT